MKKICISIIVILGILSATTIKVNAAQAQVNIGIVGEVKKGSKIDIVIDLQNMANLYAASVDYTYDNSIISIEEIVVSPNIDNGTINEAYKETAASGNKVRYGYTNMGEVEGFSGDSNFLIIKAKVLKDGEIKLNKENLEVVLVKYKGEISDMSKNVYFPGESWEVTKDPAGETTYKSIEVKANSLSPNKDLVVPGENKTDPEVKTEEAKEETDNSKNEEEEEADDENKDETSSFGILVVIGIMLVLVGAVVVIKKRQNNKEAS